MPRILIVDDDPDIVHLLETTLTFQGHSVATARNGAEAWRTLQHVSPDVIILDLNMPGLDGRGLCRRVRADPRLRSIGIVVLTGQVDQRSRVAALEAGADEYLTKPFEPRELRQCLEAVLSRRPASATAGVPLVAMPSAPAGQIVVLLGAKGGVGTSALGANLAVAVARERTACLVDLDLEAFRGGTIADLARGKHPQFGWELLSDHLLEHGSGARLLPGPLSPAEAEHVTGEHVAAALELLRRHHALVLADLAADYGEVTRAALALADRLLLVVTPDVLALKGAHAAIEFLGQARFPTSKIQVVVNQMAPAARLSLGDVRRSVRAPIAATIPYGDEEFVNAVTAGTPLVQTRPEHPAGLAIRRLAAAVAVPQRET